MKHRNNDFKDDYMSPFDMMFGLPAPPKPPQPSSMPTQLLAPFLSKDGTIDYDKVMNNVGQVMGIIQQAGPLFKEIAPLFSMFKNKK